MKLKLLILFCLTIAAKITYAQPASGSYVIDNDIDKFVGTWMWVSGSDTLKIVLKKEKVYFKAPFDFHADRLVGWHFYKKNGSLVESSIGYVNTSYDNNSTIIGASNEYNKDIADLIFLQLTNKRHGNLKLTSFDNGTKLEWSLSNTEGVKINQPGSLTLIFPQSIILNKI